MISPLDLISSVAILTLMVLPGFLLAKFRLVDGRFALGLSNFILYGAQTCLLVRAFIQTELTTDVLRRMVGILVLSAIVHLLFTGIAYLFYHRAEAAVKKVLRFATIFTNAGYMSIALVEILFPTMPEITVYASVYLVFLNLYVWSMGCMIFTGDRSYLSVKHMVLNPAIISTIIGLVIFFTQTGSFIMENSVTSVLYQAVDLLADTVSPLSMVVVGVRLGLSTFKGLFRDKYLYIYLGVRLLLSPALVWVIVRIALLIFGFVYPSAEDRSIITSLVLICASTPAATATSMFAEKFNGDAGYAGKLVSISTIFSVITMPLCSFLLLIP